MKAYLLALAIILVFGAGCSGITGFFVNEPKVETHLADETAAPLLLEGVQLPADEPVFVDLALLGWDDKRIIIEGGLVGSVSGKALGALPVRIICDSVIVGEGTSDEKGLFSITTKGYCNGLSEAWAEVDYEGNKYESYHLQLTGYEQGSVLTMSDTRMAGGEQSSVPEFSVVGAGIALLAGVMVLALTRKN